MATTKKKEELNMPSGFMGSATNVGVNNSNQAAIKEQMNINSKAWWEADDTGKAELEAANKLLASKLGSGVTFDPGTGVWSGQADRGAAFDFATPQPTFESSYSQRIDDMLNSIMNRQPFSYDHTTDPLYAQYADAYTRNGQRAMQDTLGQVSARTGGMASSYAGTAAQDSYNQYMSQLNDKIPELRQLAYEMWMDQNNLQYQDLSLLQGMDDQEYNRYQDALNNWYADRDFAYGVYGDEQALAGDRADMMASVGDFSGYKNLGFTDEEIAKLQAYWQAQQSSGGGSGGRGSGDGEVPAGIWDYDKAKDNYMDGIISGAALKSYVYHGLMSQSKANQIAQENGIAGTTSSNPTTEVADDDKWYDGSMDKVNNFFDGVRNNAGSDGMNPSYFAANQQTIETYLASGKKENAAALVENIWGDLSSAQQREINEQLARYGGWAED